MGIRESTASANKMAHHWTTKRTFPVNIYNLDKWKKPSQQTFSKAWILQSWAIISMMIQSFSDTRETPTSISSEQTDLASAQPDIRRVLIHRILMSNLAVPSLSTLPQHNPHHSVMCLQNTRNKMTKYASKALNSETKKSYFWIILDELKGLKIYLD